MIQYNECEHLNQVFAQIMQLWRMQTKCILKAEHFRTITFLLGLSCPTTKFINGKGPKTLPLLPTADRERSNKIVFCMKAFHYILLVRRKINCCDYGLVYSLPLLFVVVVGSFMWYMLSSFMDNLETSFWFPEATIKR